MPAIRLARRPAVRLRGLAARAGLVLLAALASVLVTGRLQMPPAVRTSAVGRAPTALVVDAHTRRVFVANLGSNTVSMLDATSGAVLATVMVAPHPSALALATTAGRVFAVSDAVTPDGGGRVSVLDASSGCRLRTVALGRGTHLLAVHERTSRVFVTNASDASVSVLDARSGRVLRTIPLLFIPSGIAVDERTDRVFLLTVAPGFQPFPTVVHLLDARSGTVLRTVPVGLSAAALAVDERTGQAFVSNTRDRTVLMLDGRTASVVRTTAVAWAPGALAVDERTGDIVVANAYDSSVSLLDAASGHVVRTVALGLPPCAIAVDQRRGYVVVLTSEEFVPSAPAGQVQVLDGRTGRLLHTVPVGADASALRMAHDDERCGRRAAGHDLSCHIIQPHAHHVRTGWQRGPGAPLPVHAERLAVVQPKCALCRRQRLVPCGHGPTAAVGS
jgi:YVTN family beta-propeller protein